MGYRLVIPEKLNKKIIKFDKSVQKTLYSYIKKNLLDADESRRHGKALTGNLKGMWRYKVMDYRLIVEIQADMLIIVVVDYNHRNKIHEKYKP